MLDLPAANCQLQLHGADISYMHMQSQNDALFWLQSQFHYQAMSQRNLLLIEWWNDGLVYYVATGR